MIWVTRFRHWLIRRLVGRMEICKNMTIVNGEVEYGGRHGGAICEDNKFVIRAD